MPAVNTAPEQGSHPTSQAQSGLGGQGVGRGREKQEKTDTAHKCHLNAYSPLTQSFLIC